MNIDRLKQNKNYIFGLAIFVLLLLGTVWYSKRMQSIPAPVITDGLSEPLPKAKPKPELKAYANAKLGYEISIPENWTIRDEETGTTVTFTSPVGEAFRKDIEAGRMYGEGYMADLTLSKTTLAELQTYIAPAQKQNTLEAYINNNDFFQDITKTEINGNIAYTAQEGGLGVYEVVFIQGPGNVIYKMFFADDRGNEHYDYSSRDAIIQSFKILQ